MKHGMEREARAVAGICRSQTIGIEEAESLVLQLVSTAYSKGRADSSREVGAAMLRAFDSVTGKK